MADYDRVHTVYQMLTPKPQELLRGDRRYIREGEFLVYDDKKKTKKKRYVFLFNDTLLITKKEGSHKFWLRIYIALRSQFINSELLSGMGEEYIKLNCRQKGFAFFGYNLQDFHSDLEKCISGAIEEAPAQTGKKPKKQKTREKQEFADISSFVDPPKPKHKQEQPYDTKGHNFNSGVKLQGIKPVTADDYDDNGNAPQLNAPPRRTSLGPNSMSPQQPQKQLDLLSDFMSEPPPNQQQVHNPFSSFQPPPKQQQQQPFNPFLEQPKTQPQNNVFMEPQTQGNVWGTGGNSSPQIQTVFNQPQGNNVFGSPQQPQQSNNVFGSPQQSNNVFNTTPPQGQAQQSNPFGSLLDNDFFKTTPTKEKAIDFM